MICQSVRGSSGLEPQVFQADRAGAGVLARESSPAGQAASAPASSTPDSSGAGAADKLIHAIFTLCIMLHDFILLRSRNLLQ